jgi:predicted xylose isomerase-like sugar epimerase
MEIEQLPKDEAVRRLRTLGQPATLYGRVVALGFRVSGLGLRG